MKHMMRAALIFTATVLLASCQYKSQRVDILPAPKNLPGQEKPRQEEMLVGVDQAHHSILIWDLKGTQKNKITYAGNDLINSSQVEIKQAEPGSFYVLFKNTSGNSLLGLTTLKFSLAEKLLKPISSSDEAVFLKHLVSSDHIILNRDWKWNVVPFSDVLIGFTSLTGNSTMLLSYSLMKSAQAPYKFEILAGTLCGLRIGKEEEYISIDKVNDTEVSLMSNLGKVSTFKVSANGVSCVSSQNLELSPSENIRLQHHTFVRGTRDLIGYLSGNFWRIKKSSKGFGSPESFYSRQQNDVTAITSGDLSGASFYFSNDTDVFNYNLNSGVVSTVIKTPGAGLVSLEVVK